MGKSGRSSTQAEEAARVVRGGGLRGGRSSRCRCHCYRRCHIGSLLYRQPLRSCDRSRAAVTTVRGRQRERARARVPAHRARLQGERASQRASGRSRRLPTPPLAALRLPPEHARKTIRRYPAWGVGLSRQRRNLPAEAEIDPSRKAPFKGLGPRARHRLGVRTWR